MRTMVTLMLERELQCPYKTSVRPHAGMRPGCYRWSPLCFSIPSDRDSIEGTEQLHLGTKFLFSRARTAHYPRDSLSEDPEALSLRPKYWQRQCAIFQIFRTKPRKLWGDNIPYIFKYRSTQMRPPLYGRSRSFTNDCRT